MVRAVKFVLQRLELAKAKRVERRSLEQLGASLRPSPRIAVIDEKLAGFERAIPLSLARDRADWAAAPVWARCLVVVRGVVDRAVLRALCARASADRVAACAELALASLDSAQGDLARIARADHQRVVAAEAALQPLPGAVREVHHLGRAVAIEARRRLVPRLPGLVGLGVGWWIAQTFTDSEISAHLHSWGLGAGPRHAVSSDTLHAMSFWLPLLAAAVCSYASSRITALIRARYSSEAEHQG
jgi:hypothetical protein